MVFACQSDSFLKEFTSRVVSCTPVLLPAHSKSGNKKTLLDDHQEQAYEVILEDTILFPEGGGQPSDHGTLDGKEVLQVTRRGVTAVHLLREPFNEGQSVQQILDWDRRLDHMQQHSGQHLITALADSIFGFRTTSWWLGEQTSYIELDTPGISEQQMNQLEQLVNEKIVAALSITIKVYETGDPKLTEFMEIDIGHLLGCWPVENNKSSGHQLLEKLGLLGFWAFSCANVLQRKKHVVRDEELKDKDGEYWEGPYYSRSSIKRTPTMAKTRGLPEDHQGAVRVVSISGLDNNMCCGTHVSNLGQLQAIKLLFVEKGKKGRSNLHFLSGRRILSYLGENLQREQRLTSLLNNAPSDHVELVEKLQKSLKVSLKNLQATLRDLAILESEKLNKMTPQPTFFTLHRKEAEADFMSTFINHSTAKNCLLLLSVGEEKGAGQMVMHGDPEIVQQLGPRVCDVLGGKGAGKGNKFQAKVTSLGNRAKAEEIIRQHLGL